MIHPSKHLKRPSSRILLFALILVKLKDTIFERNGVILPTCWGIYGLFTIWE